MTRQDVIVYQPTGALARKIRYCADLLRPRHRNCAFDNWALSLGRATPLAP
jgi:hypothetical protein